MTRSARILGFLAAVAVLASCSASPTPTPIPTPSPSLATKDPNGIAAIIALEMLAGARARSVDSGPVLRQIDLIPQRGATIFRYVDAAARAEITLTASGPPIAPSWDVQKGVSPLVGNRGAPLGLGTLRIGPVAVEEAAHQAWPGCSVTNLTLFEETGGLMWRAFCLTAQGAVSGAWANSSNAFVPSKEPPVVAPPTATPVFAGPRVVLGQAVIPVDLSITDAEHAQGLSDRPGMIPGAGMLFIYKTDATYGFWMRHMHFPLDFVWIGSNCTVVSLDANVPAAPTTPDSQLTIYQPAGPVRYVLEINGGEAARFSIAPGDRVAFRGPGLESTTCFMP